MINAETHEKLLVALRRQDVLEQRAEDWSRFIQMATVDITGLLERTFALEARAEAVERALRRLGESGTVQWSEPTPAPQYVDSLQDISNTDDPDPSNPRGLTHPPAYLQSKHLHCWLVSERASFPSMAEWFNGAWMCVGETDPVTPAQMWARGWRWGEVAWASTKIDDERRPEQPDLAEPTDEMIQSMATCLLAAFLDTGFRNADELLMSAGGRCILNTQFRLMASRAFEHAPYLVPRPKLARWSPISSDGIFPAGVVWVRTPSGAVRVWNYGRLTMSLAAAAGWTEWTPCEPPR